MTEKEQKKPARPDYTFEIEGINGAKIPVEVYFTAPLELAHKVAIKQYVFGEKYPFLYSMSIDRAHYTKEYVVTDIGCVALFVARDREHFLYLLKERVLKDYDGDLVSKIEVLVE
uniref:Uncharacterized protein n=1 Tax=Thermofilum adornatum TaxID=1365176 RepID=A0A7C1GL99_9CREN